MGPMCQCLNGRMGYVRGSSSEERGGGFAMEKRERRDGGFGMEMMERRGGGFGMEMMERRGGGFAMEKRERSVRQQFRIGREGRRALTRSKSKSIYPSIKKATPH